MSLKLLHYHLKSLTATSILAFFLCFNILGQVNGEYFFERDLSTPVFNNGNTLKNAWTGGLNSAQVSTIHLNDDGIEDLVLFDRTGNSIIPFVWDVGISDWQYAPEYTNLFPQLEHWMLLRDYNCDGKKDIFSYVLGGIGVWKNTSVNSQLSFEYVSDPYVYSSLLGGTVANLYVSKVDIPDINDVDGDGDLDVLTFGIVGERVEYHQNLSQELGYDCDSLKYAVANLCWGHFLETGFGTNTCQLFDTCLTNVATPKAVRHSGSTVLSLDLNDDGVKDLLLGDVSFRNVVALFNDSKGVNMNTSMLSQDTTFPSNSIPVDMQLFPGSFYEDIDKDGIPDLTFSPNTDNGTENTESIWQYKNYGTETNPVFSHIKNNWMQDEMIEVGTNAHPVLFDFDNDGDLDLFIGNFGYFDVSLANNYYSKITLYENTGSSNSPEFTLLTDDFANVSTSGIEVGAIPTFGDIDGDQDIDMIVGDHTGMLHLFTNSSNSFSTMTLSLTASQIIDDNGTTIDVGYAAKPQLFDIDGDNDLDLIIGEENANINFYENIGNTNSYSLRLQTETFGGVDVSEWWTTLGNSTPFLFKNQQGETQLFVGSNRGFLYHFNNIDGNVLGNFTLIDSTVSNLPLSSNTSPSLGFLNNDTIPDLIVGIERGGLNLFIGSGDASISIDENTNLKNINIYPNPVSNILSIIGFETDEELHYSIADIAGRVIDIGKLTSQINLNHLSNGTYLITFSNRSNRTSKLFIKE